MYTKLTQAHKRPLTGQERFGLLLFVVKFLLSRFGIFLVFIGLNILGNKSLGKIVSEINNPTLGTKAQSLIKDKNSLNEKRKIEIDQLGSSPANLFSRLQIYCIIAAIVTLFLNPQQTKYFGGLAVALKQVGLFSKYGKSEKTVYVFSWVFIVVFIQMSYNQVYLIDGVQNTKLLFRG